MKNPITDDSADRSLFQREAKSIFMKWEKLRVLYNLILILALAAALGLSRQPLIFWFRNPFIMLEWTLAAAGANCCYFAAPAVESYLCWLGIKGHWITALLFAAGALVSIPLVFVVGLSPAGFLLPAQP